MKKNKIIVGILAVVLFFLGTIVEAGVVYKKETENSLNLNLVFVSGVWGFAFDRVPDGNFSGIVRDNGWFVGGFDCNHPSYPSMGKIKIQLTESSNFTGYIFVDDVSYDIVGMYYTYPDIVGFFEGVRVFKI